MEAVQGVVRRADDVQRRKPFLAFPLAVLKKFGEDRAGQLAALIAYYGFFSLFPLLLAFVTLTAMLFKQSDMQDRLVDAALSQFPGDRRSPACESPFTPRQGRGPRARDRRRPLACLAGIKAAQNAMDHVWDVPMKRQPSFPIALLRAVLMLLTLGVFVLLASFLGRVAAGTEDAPIADPPRRDRRHPRPELPDLPRGLPGAHGRDFQLAGRVRRRHLRGVVWTVLQALGGYVIGHKLESAEETYGFFAVVIGLLTLDLPRRPGHVARAEMNVVRARRLWPRALDPARLMEADERALRDHARVEERREEETVEVQFGDDGGAGRLR